MFQSKKIFKGLYEHLGALYLSDRIVNNFFLLFASLHFLNEFSIHILLLLKKEIHMYLCIYIMKSFFPLILDMNRKIE
jgi:hypothetical protein